MFYIAVACFSAACMLADYLVGSTHAPAKCLYVYSREC